MSESVVASGYGLVLPPGWVRIPLRGGTEEALDEKVFRGIEVIPEGVPREKGMAFRMEVRRRVARRVREARKGGGLDLYVPVGARPGALMAASFVVAGMATEWEEGAEPERALGRLAGMRRGGAEGEVRGVGETVAVRWEYVTEAGGEDEDEGEKADTGARRVEYVLPVPGQEGGRWVAVNFATAGDGDPGSDISRALTELFDAIMTTFRWEYAA